MSRPAPGIERVTRYRVTPAMSPSHLRPASVLGSSTLVELAHEGAVVDRDRFGRRQASTR